jgi:hypothetical protein
VLTVITAQLEVLESRSGAHERRITELLIDTGRRPDEACVLVWDCLQRCHDGKPTLIYTDSKNNRPGRRLPIAGAHPIQTPSDGRTAQPRDRGATPDRSCRHRRSHPVGQPPRGPAVDHPWNHNLILK